jgi:hypothetical protein
VSGLLMLMHNEKFNFCHQIVTINQLRKKRAALVIPYTVNQLSEKNQPKEKLET